MRRFLSRRRGFTFLEIMLVVLIIGILVSLVVPRLGGRVTTARETAARTTLRGVEQALELFFYEYDRYPEDLDELLSPPPPLGNPDGEPEEYLDESPRDPWGNVVIYNYLEDEDDFDLYSMGPNGEDDGGEGDDVLPRVSRDDDE